MFKVLVRLATVLALMTVIAGSLAARTPDACVPDSKLIGRFELSIVDAPDTWWGLTKNGMLEAGIPDDDDALEATIEGWFGATFASLTEAVTALVTAVEDLDRNGNNYVCAYRLGGTRTSLGDPNFQFVLFAVRDDKHNDD